MSLSIEQILSILADVPQYQSFLTVDELRKSTLNLAQRFPGEVEIIPVGKSRHDYPIEALKIGHGSKNALLFAMPHPNEPIGSMTLEFLSQKLAEDKNLCASLDYTFYIVKCVDPDGTKLNEGWFKGPFTLSNYARHYYRPPSSKQVEWTFPIQYKKLDFNQPLPETQGLMNLIEKIQPDFIYSLHNSGFGGAYFYITEDTPDLYPQFYQVVKSQGVPLHLGEPEAPYAKNYSQAIYELIDIRQMYDFLEMQLNGGDPTAVITSGGSSFSYARRFKQTFCLVCEMPYFYNPAIEDMSPSDVTRREAILGMTQVAKQDMKTLADQYEKIKDVLTAATAFKDVFDENLASMQQYYNAQEAWATSDPSTLEKASVAQKFDSLKVNRFYQLLSFGMFVRLIEDQINIAGNTPELAGALAEAARNFEDLSKKLEKEIPYSVIPIQKLVGVQLGSGLVTLSQLDK